MSETEKITINLSVVDLGKIDLLVEQGFYSNRTDLIRSAVRNLILGYEQEIQSASTRKSLSAGVISYNHKDLDDFLLENKKLDIRMIGLLHFQKDITPELALATIERIQVYGVFKASPEVLEALKDRIQ